MKIRSRLLLLMLGTLIPIIAFSGVMLVLFNRQTRAATEKGLVETARALSVEVDQQISASISGLEGLSTSEHLTAGDLAEFHRAARAILPSQPGWKNIVLFTPAGRQLLNTLKSYGEPLPMAGNPEVIARVVSTRSPIVSDLFVGRVEQRPIIMATVPVFRNGMPVYVLGAALDPGTFTNLLLQQRVPPDAIGTLLDRNKAIIGRTRAADRFVGQTGTPDLAAKMDEVAEGAFRLFTEDGDAVYAAISRSPRTGWTIALGVPQATADASLRSSLWLLLMVGGGSIILGSLVAVRGARRIAIPISALSTAAAAFVRGDPVHLRPCVIAEVNEVTRAMEFASQERLGMEAAAAALADVARELAGTLDPAQVMNQIVSAVAEVFGVSQAALYQTDTAANDLVCAAAVGGAGLEKWVGRRVAKGEGTAGRAFADGRVISCSDLTSRPGIILPSWASHDGADLDGRNAVTSIPLRARQRIVGVLSLGYESGRVLTDRELRLLSAFADQAAIALENARLHKDVQERLIESETRQERMEALLGVGEELARIQPVESLLGRIAETAGLLFHASSVGFRLVEGEDLVVCGTWDSADDPMPTPRLKIGKSLSGIVAASGEPLLVQDPANDPRLMAAHRESYSEKGVRAFLGVPIKVKAQVAGVLTVRTTRDEGFSTADVEMAVAFAAQAAIALENSRLYQETQRAFEELSQTQTQLIQAQKMDAIGQLAGGIAHDFNNLLTVIGGRSQMLLRSLLPGHPGRRDVELIKATSNRAAALTSQLLAFSRKQVLQAKPLDLNALVGGVAPMLTRLIGENVELLIVPGRGIGQVMADPGHLEQVVMNLLVNARDAMLEGGSVRVETGSCVLQGMLEHDQGRIPPGQYVTLIVQDSGFGMDSKTLARIFEPFFTTKDASKGTGLGLSTVYGIVRQSGGFIGVDSKVGRGTTFTIYLPRTAAPKENETEKAEPSPADRSRGRETVLIVEDEDEVRRLASDILKDSGYTVLDTGDPLEALVLGERHRDEISLLISDFMLPAMRGPALAARLVSLNPELRVLYMSGYTDGVTGPNATIEPAGLFLQKPFAPDIFARAVRDALDQPSRRSVPAHAAFDVVLPSLNHTGVEVSLV
jgi:signal transduction histidine kinase/FixJ family two-component response regulator